MAEQLTELEALRRNVIRDPFNTFARRLYAERVEEESSDNPTPQCWMPRPADPDLSVFTPDK